MMQFFWCTILRSCFVSSLMVIIFMSLAAPLSALSIRQNDQPATPFDFLSLTTVPNGQALGGISFNGGAATPYNPQHDATPNNLQFANALALNGVPSTSSDQFLRNDFVTEKMPILPVSQPVADILGMNLGGASTSQPLGDTSKPQSLEGFLEDQPSGSEGPEPGNNDESSSVKPHDPCDPLDTQNAKLRPRLNADVDCGKKKDPKKTSPPGQGFGAPPPPRKYRLPRPGTRLQKPNFPKGSPESDLSDYECFRYTLGILPLGVCDSGNLDLRGVSTYTYKNALFFILYDATLVGNAVCPDPTEKYCCFLYNVDTGIADICQKLKALKETAPPGV